MKILYFNSSIPDYLQDLTYSGLAAVLGPENIIDRPWNIHFHLNRRGYPYNLGYVKGAFLSSLLRRKTDFDAVIIASAKKDCFREYLKTARTIRASVPVIFIDGGDGQGIGGDLDGGRSPLFQEASALRPFNLIFKREYLCTESHPGNVLPLPFSFKFDAFPVLPVRTGFSHDVVFWAIESHPIRSAVFNVIEGKFDCIENGSCRNQVFKKYKRKGLRYLGELQASRIVLNFRGYGWDTMRYWEAPALGCFVISQRPGIKIPDNFREGREIVFCKDDLSDLIELCTYYLDHESEREAIARNALELARTKHSNVARAKYILGELANRFGLHQAGFGTIPRPQSAGNSRRNVNE